jgi:hypothetical protein
LIVNLTAVIALTLLLTATMRLPYRLPVARRSTAARVERKRTPHYPPLKIKLYALRARTSVRGGKYSERADAAEAAGLRE